MSGFGDSWQRWPRGDVERYPLLKQQMAQMLAAREAVGNYQPPKAIGEVRYVDDAELNAEIADFRTALEAKPRGFVEPFMTAPSPGIIAAAMKNEFYDSEEAYLAAVAAAIQVEYEAIVKSGFLLQLDCPDLALERHLTYNDRPLGEFLGFVERVVAAINKALVNVPREVGDRNPREHEFTVQLRSFDAARSADHTGVPVLLALASALLGKPLKGGMAVVGGINLGGSIEPVHMCLAGRRRR
jgi:hypothetical protein